MKRNQLLDLLKGISIIFVVFTHFHWTEEDRLIFLFPFSIDMAVPIFMIISGYVYAISYHRNKVESFSDAYNKKIIIKLFIRYTFPFLTIFIVECMIDFIWAIEVDNHRISVIYTLFEGGVGPGSYYYPILIQLIFIYPIIYSLVKKYKFYGLLIILIFNAVYEICVSIFNVNAESYRLLIFRYILLISVGAYSYMFPNKIGRKILLSSFFIGIIFIVYTRYLNCKFLFFEQWVGTNFIACMYIIPLFYIIINKKLSSNNIFVCIICKCGMASYYIFLFQMIFYAYFYFIVYNIFHVSIYQLIICLFVCTVAGYLFYKIEDRIIVLKTREVLIKY